MRLSPRTRAVILAVALAATLVAAFAPEEGASAVPGTKAMVVPAVRKVKAADIAEVPDIAIRRPLTAEPATDPFSPNAWLPPPPPPAKPEPPPPPMAPPFPYSYLGRVDDGGKASVLLARADKSVTVQVGDMIDGVWRVDKIAERSIELIYQPLQQRQSISAGSE